MRRWGIDTETGYLEEFVRCNRTFLKSLPNPVAIWGSNRPMNSNNPKCSTFYVDVAELILALLCYGYMKILQPSIDHAFVFSLATESSRDIRGKQLTQICCALPLYRYASNKGADEFSC